MVAVLLPGLDGTGNLFGGFLKHLPENIEGRIIRYPRRVRMTIADLAAEIGKELPQKGPYLIVAESYSGPIALRLAETPVGDLRAVVLVSSFVYRPLGRLGQWFAGIIAWCISKGWYPARAVTYFLLGRNAPEASLSSFIDALALVDRSVVRERVRDILTVDVRSALSRCTVRLVFLWGRSDRLLHSRGQRHVRRASNVEMRILPGPHLLLQSAPAECVSALRELGVFPRP